LAAGVGAFASAASAQEWANKMFTGRSHNFGTVAKNSQQVFHFELQNIYKETVHISGVRTSCGCTTPSILKDTLKTWEKGAIIAKYNTDSFLGQKGATVTVTIDKPFFAEVQLQVKGYIRGDVVFSPGAVNFGEVEPGTAAERKVQLSYAGRQNWEITDIRSGNEHLEVAMQPLSRSSGRVNYELTVRLKEDAPAGFLSDYLHIVTNDGQANIPLAVSGRVVPAVTVSPASFFLGKLDPGQTATQQLIVRAKTPFRIVDIKCDDDSFQFSTSEEAKPLHVIPVTFTASKPGKVACRILVETDLPGGNAECVASATVNEPASVAGGSN
jgi:hypothetical protein